MAHESWLYRQLENAEFAAEYLNAALADGDRAAFMLALRDVVRARGGITALARRTELNRVALNRTLSKHGNPELRSLARILDTAGLQLLIAAKADLRGKRIRTDLASLMQPARGIAYTRIPDLATNPKHLKGFGRSSRVSPRSPSPPRHTA